VGKKVKGKRGVEDKIKSFTDLTVWQKRHQLTMMIYKVSKTFPKEEKYGLTSQMRRAAVSVEANIAEGFAKRGIKDKVNYYNIAQGSISEVKCYVILSRDLGYHNQYDDLWKMAADVSSLLTNLIKSIERRKS